MNTIYSALFVDFDNMYSRLRDTSGKEAAEEFANQPIRWLEWLENDMPLAHFGVDSSTRRILIRKCYLNPAAFGKFRPYFTQAGFEVVDCPKLTNEGKTSADIHMVMDIMDALQHPSNFDEFILFSADADFTPVLLRVRQHKRMSIVIAAGYSSPAYKAACDLLPPPELFLQEALGVGQAEEVEKADILPASTSDSVLEKLAEVISQKLNTSPIVYAYELPALYKRVDEFRVSTTWLDYHSLRLLTNAVVSLKADLMIYEDKQYGSWGVQRDTSIRLSLTAPIETKGENQRADSQTPLAVESRESLLKQITQMIIERVRLSPRPLTMAKLADLVKEQHADELKGYEGWLGAMSFKALLKEMDLGGLVINNTIPGYVYDPTRHQVAGNIPQEITELYKNPITDEFKRKYPEIERLAAKIHQLTDMPYLLPEHYALILMQIVRTVRESGFQLNQTSRVVRDRCVERGAPVARSHVNFIIVGINYAGLRLGDPENSNPPEVLAEYLYKNAMNLCQAAQFTLSDEEEKLARTWLVEGLDKPFSSP